MSFLNPLLLVGMGAIAVPIVIHLLNQRKFQRVVWAAMRFVQASVEQNQRRMRLEDLLLLALRCALLIILALALARPALRSTATHLFGQAPVTAVLLLDHSSSMSQTDGVTSRFDRAQQAAAAIIQALPSGSAAAVFLVSDAAQGLVPEPTHDLNLVRQLIQQARRSDRSSDLLPGVRQAVELLRGRPALRKEIYLVTDGQALGWQNRLEIQNLLSAVRTEIQSRILLVGDPEEHNLGITGLRLASGLAPLDQPLRFDVEVRNFGRQNAEAVPVKLSVDAGAPMDETTIDTLPPGAARSVSLFARLRSDGYHAVRAAIPGDRMPADDERTVAVLATREIGVLVVDGDPGGERPRPSFYLRHALQPVPPVEAGAYFIRVTLISPAELNATRLDDFEVVVLADVAEFSQTTAAALDQYVRRGGGLMVFPGPRTQTSFYNEQLGRRHPVLPAAFGSIRGQADRADAFFTLQESNYDHPIVSLWNDPGAGNLASARFFQAFDLQVQPEKPATGSPGPGPSPDAPRVVLRFRDGAPAVVEQDCGLGRVIQFSSSANTVWNDLAVRPGFVPLVHRAVGWLIERHLESLNVPVGRAFSRRASHEWVGKDVLFTAPGATNGVRELRRVELVEGTPRIEYPGTDWAGVYEALVSAEEPQAIRFSAQADPRESSLETLPPEARRELESVANVWNWTPALALKDRLEKERVGTELWMALVIAALVLGLAETFLAQRFSRPK